MSFPFLKGETQPCSDLEKQRHPKKPSSCFWLVMWKQEPGQLLQNPLLTLISQTGTDLFWLSLRVHTPTRTDVRGELSCTNPASIHHPALQLAQIPLWIIPGTSNCWPCHQPGVGAVPMAGKGWQSLERQGGRDEICIHPARQMNELPFSRALSAPSANPSEFVTIIPPLLPINKI